MKIRGIIYIVLACLGWGTACLFVNALTALGFESIPTAAARCTVAAICLIVYMLIKYKGFVKISLKQLLVVAIEGISFFGMAAAYFFAIINTSASTASLLLSLAPVIVTVVSVIFFKEKMTVKKILAIALSLVGGSLVVGITTGLKFNAFGLLMGSLGTLFYASYSICTKLAMRMGMQADVNITYSFCFSALSSLVVSNPIPTVLQIAEKPMPSALLVVGVGVVTGAFAGLMYTNGMKLLPAGIASPMSVLETITATVLSVAFLNEVLGVSSVIGIALVMLSVVMLSMEKP